MDWIIDLTNSTFGFGIATILGAFIGSVITFWVAHGLGFREGTERMQKHYENVAAQKQEIEPTEMPAPKEVVEAEKKPARRRLLQAETA